MSVPNYHVPMYQGSDWSPKVNWYAGGLFMGAIEEIDPGYPTKLQVTGHQLPSASETPVILSGIEGEGMTILNSKDLAILRATRLDDDHFTMPVSTIKGEWVVGTGEITYYLPKDISVFSEFRATLRTRVHKDAVLATLTTGNSKIVTNTNDASIQLNLTAAETAALSFTRAYLNCEAVTAGGGVEPVFFMTIDLIRETTR